MKGSWPETGLEPLWHSPPRPIPLAGRMRLRSAADHVRARVDRSPAGRPTMTATFVNERETTRDGSATSRPTDPGDPGLRLHQRRRPADLAERLADPLRPLADRSGDGQDQEPALDLRPRRRRRPAPDPGQRQDGAGRWSPDGRRRLRLRSGREERSLSSADRRRRGAELTRHRPGIGGLVWSPDGTRLPTPREH